MTDCRVLAAVQEPPPDLITSNLLKRKQYRKLDCEWEFPDLTEQQSVALQVADPKCFTTAHETRTLLLSLRVSLPCPKLYLNCFT